MADRTGAAGYEKRHAGLGFGDRDGVIGRHRRNAETGASLEARLVRKPDGQSPKAA